MYEEDKTFFDYDIDNKIKFACKTFGYLKPSEIQKDLINQILLKHGTKDGENLVISSKAGSGKTFCYLLYLLNKIDINCKKLQAVILVPTRELAMQTVSYFDKINNENEPSNAENHLEVDSNKNFKIDYKLLIGGRNINERHETGLKDISEENTQIIVGTLGKIYATFSKLISNKKNSFWSGNSKMLENFKCLIIDEADKVIYQNKSANLENLIKLFLNPDEREKECKNRYRINKRNKNSLVLSSASFDKKAMNFYLNYVDEFILINPGNKNDDDGLKNKGSIQNLQDDSTNNLVKDNFHNEPRKNISNIIKPLQINSQSEIFDNIKEYYHVFTPQIKTTYFEQKYQKLFEILNFLKNDFKQCLIFYNQKGRGEELACDLRDFGWSTTFIHGDLNQDQRILIYEKIKNIQVKIILATDLFSRGIDLSTVDLVINFDMPYNSVEYYHRVGRTGRYNSYGVSITFLNENEQGILQDMFRSDAKLKFLKMIDMESMNLLKEDLQYVQEKNVMSKEIQEKVKILDIENKFECRDIETEIENETEFLNKKRRRVQYEKESIISAWVEPEEKLFEVENFNYYEEDIEGKLESENQEPIEKEENKCQFCLYCNLFKIFDTE